MLAAHCPRHQARVLIPTSRIRGIDRDGDTFLVRWRCSCGGDGVTAVPRRRPSV